MPDCFKNASQLASQKETTGEDPLEASTNGLTHEQRCNQAILQNMGEVLKDKVQQVIGKAFIMVNAYLDIVEKTPGLNPKQDTQVFETFLMSLLDKLADSKTCTQSQAVYRRLFNLQQLDCAYLIAFVYKPHSFANSKSQ